MVIMSTFTKAGTPKLHTSLKVSYTNIRGFRSNFLHCEFYLKPNFPDILALSETKTGSRTMLTGT